MKALLIGLLFVFSISAHANDNERLLGAIAGGYLGSTIGGGDGKKAATVLGAVIGYNIGPQILGNDDRYNHYEPPLYGRKRHHGHVLQYRQSDIYKICERENPYYKDSRLFWSYNRGCVQRMSEEMRVLEQQVYEQGYNGR